MNKTILVLINGHAGVGKDTFVGFCKDYAEKEKSCRVYNIHRSDAPKMALKSLGWSGEKDEDARNYLDGVYGSKTSEAVKVFQSVFNLPQTGVVDYATWYKISDVYVGVTRIAELRSSIKQRTFVPPLSFDILNSKQVPKINYFDD